VEDELGHQINEEELVEEEKEFVIDEFIWWASQGEFMSYEDEPYSVEVLCADLQCTECGDFKGMRELEDSDDSADEEEEEFTADEFTAEDLTGILLTNPPGLRVPELKEELSDEEEWKIFKRVHGWGEFETEGIFIKDEEPVQINLVGDDKTWVKIAIDSGAAESVCPKDWAQQFKVVECKPGQTQNFVNASGGQIKHYGEKKVALQTGEKKRIIGMPFQACDVKRPLASVKKICEKGNIVQFGPTVNDNFIMSVTTGEKIWLSVEKGQYVMEAALVTESPF
jgi:hypothetical protein